jgi:sulfite reductase (NADPH) flavoprotein alpha-component
MNALTPQPAFVSFIPENAPFSAEQRAWLNGFFAGALSPEAPAVGTSNAAETAGDDDEAPWHDQTLALPERMKLAQGRPLRKRMMAAMAQQDCGQCGYNCRDYSSAIVDQAEERLNLCAPGGKETARMLKRLSRRWAAAQRTQRNRKPKPWRSESIRRANPILVPAVRARRPLRQFFSPAIA